MRLLHVRAATPHKLSCLLVLALLVWACTSLAASAATPALRTLSELSGFTKTGRYDEVIALCADFQQAWPEAVRCIEFGRTPEGRPMQALVVSTRGALDPAAAHDQNLPVTLVQGGIHAGEIDGKDAGFWLLRELLDGTLPKDLLQKQVLLFVPVFNIDGHERFGRWNRPNQRGPEEMGWRTTGQNYNLNRDYAKADTPEMRAMLALVDQWDPLLYVDLHVTDGAKFEHDVSVHIEPLHAGDPALREIGAQLSKAVLADLAKQGSLPLAFYPSFVIGDDPASGVTDGVAPPRFSTGYFQLRNRFGVLVETHSWKDYATRVRITRNTVLDLLTQVAAHGADWRAAARAADLRSAALAGKPVALDFLASDKVRTVDFRGYAYTRQPSAISGGLMTRYDESRPQIWKLPLRDDVQPSLQVDAPLAGYLVPAAHAEWVAEKLALHGIESRRLAAALPKLKVGAFRASSSSFAPQSVEGHQRLTLTGAWADETRDVAAGALFVPIAQARARLLMALLEPLAPDSLASWGEFNNAFEQKEYMEAYVAEEVAQARLAADPALAEAFNQRLATDSEFARDPNARLQFFARKHESWDERFGLYPVLRMASAPP